jgi:hypothetical protein
MLIEGGEKPLVTKRLLGDNSLFIPLKAIPDNHIKEENRKLF